MTDSNAAHSGSNPTTSKQTNTIPTIPIVPTIVQSEWIATAKDLFAGTIGACAGIVVGQPLDTIKLRMQVASAREGALTVMRRTIIQEGPRALFKGLASPLIANAPINAIVFGARGNMSRMLDDSFPRPQAQIESGKPSYWRAAVAASWAGSAQLIVCVPMELVKCKLQAQSTPLVKPVAPVSIATSISSSPATPTILKSSIASSASTGTTAVASSFSTASAAGVSASAASSAASAAASHSPSTGPIYTGTWDCVRQIYRTSGLRGLYSGWWITYWRDVPAYAAWFLAYDWTKTILQSDADLRARKPVEDWVTVVAGSVSGIATWISTYPLDVVKSVIQTSPPSTPPAELKMFHVMRTNYAREGIGFFFRGITPTLLRAVPVSAVTFLVYEYALDAMGR